MNSQVILIADDDENSRLALYDLLYGNYQVIMASNGAEAFDAAKRMSPTLALVDYNMPIENGVDLCRKLRSNDETKNIPIIMISGEDDIQKRTEAFLSGADDFISKPVSSQELMARIFSKLRWQRQLANSNDSRGPRLGNLCFDERRLNVSVDGEQLKLTHFEYNLLKYFVNNKESVLTRDQIMLDVWKSSHVNSRTVDTHVYSLRKKLEGFDHSLETVHSAGYMLKPRQLSSDEQNI